MNRAPTHATPMKPDDQNSPPFFILGCVRSGTTMLRDLLRLHPALAAPEETHFFRWAEPFGSEAYLRAVINNPVLKKHREIDGITEEEFDAMAKVAGSRSDLYRRYMALYIERRKPGARRWFDKTPQNVYGAAMIASQVPKARFIHIVREPVNVCASLRIGKVMKVERLTGAINYWRESVDIVNTIKRGFPGRVHELKYEDLVRDPLPQIRSIMTFLDEAWEPSYFESFSFRESDHAQEGVLLPAEIERIERQCALGRQRYGYAEKPAPVAPAAPAAPAAPLAAAPAEPAAPPKPKARPARKKAA